MSGNAALLIVHITQPRLHGDSHIQSQVAVLERPLNKSRTFNRHQINCQPSIRWNIYELIRVFIYLTVASDRYANDHHIPLDMCTICTYGAIYKGRWQFGGEK